MNVRVSFLWVLLFSFNLPTSDCWLHKIIFFVSETLLKFLNATLSKYFNISIKESQSLHENIQNLGHLHILERTCHDREAVETSIPKLLPYLSRY